MKSQSHRVGDILQLERRAVDLDPLTEYTLIGVYSFGKGIFQREATPGATLGTYRFFRIRADDLVLSNIQAWEGAIAHAGVEDAECIGTHRFLTYVPIDPEQVDTNYVRYYLLSEPGFALIQKASPGSVTRNRTLSIERFESLEIPLPPIDEQRRIASLLDAVQGRLEKADSLAGKAGAVAGGLRWAATRADFAGPDVTLTDVVTINPETVDPERDLETETFQYIDIGSVANGTGLITAPKTIHSADAPSRARKRVAAGDVLIATVRPNLKGVALVSVKFDGAVCSTGFAVLRPKPEVAPEYLFLQCLSDVVTEQLVESTRGGHYPAVPDHKLREVKVLVPPMEEQLLVVERLGRLSDNLAKLQTLIAKRNALLHALPKSVLNAHFDGRN